MPIICITNFKVLQCKHMKKIDSIILLAILGTLFSGYLSAVKLFSKTCAIDTGCSYFLDYPTCYYGFAIFALIFLSALANKFCSWGGQKMATARLHALRTFAGAGIIFSTYFSTVEIWQMISKKMVYGALIMPTCFYGLIFYIWVFALSLKYKAVRNNNLEKEATEESESEQRHIAQD